MSHDQAWNPLPNSGILSPKLQHHAEQEGWNNPGSPWSKKSSQGKVINNDPSIFLVMYLSSWTSSQKILLSFTLHSPGCPPWLLFTSWAHPSAQKRTITVNYINTFWPNEFSVKPSEKQIIFSISFCYHSLKYEDWNLNDYFHWISQHLLPI